MDLNFAADGDLRELSAEEAWETIENFAQGQKEWDKTFKAITEHELASLRAQANELFRNKKVWCEMPRCIAWDNVDNLSPQVLLSFEVYTSPATYPKEVEETIGVPMEVKPLDQMKLEDVGFDTFSHDIPLSSREVPSLDESKPQPQHLPSFPSLDVSLGKERGPGPLIKPHSPDSFRMKIVDNLTIYTPPSPHVASFYPKDLYCYYHPCLDDPKKHYGFKPVLLGQSGSLGVDFSNMEMIENDWKLGSKEVSLLERGFNLPVRPKEVKKGRNAGDGVRIIVIFDEEKPGSS
ncbi:hypothetical protein Tco_1336839 [Tanacetum coccineum]